MAISMCFEGVILATGTPVLLMYKINPQKPSINEFEKIPGVITQQLTFSGAAISTKEQLEVYNHPQGNTRVFFRETKEELCPPQAIHSEPCNIAPLKKDFALFLVFFYVG